MTSAAQGRCVYSVSIPRPAARLPAGHRVRFRAATSAQEAPLRNRRAWCIGDRNGHTRETDARAADGVRPKKPRHIEWPPAVTEAGRSSRA
jgi:hypothetical protein